MFSGNALAALAFLSSQVFVLADCDVQGFLTNRGIPTLTSLEISMLQSQAQFGTTYTSGTTGECCETFVQTALQDLQSAYTQRYNWCQSRNAANGSPDACFNPCWCNYLSKGSTGYNQGTQGLWKGCSSRTNTKVIW